MSRERNAAVTWLRRMGEDVLADALEQGVHRPIVYSRAGGNYPCGHPRTAANTVRVGRENGVRCAECRRRIGAASRARKAEAATHGC